MMSTYRRLRCRSFSPICGVWTSETTFSSWIDLKGCCPTKLPPGYQLTWQCMSSPFTCVCPDGLPQARHSKQRVMVDQNSGVYLRARKTQAFALPYCLTLTMSPQCSLTWSRIPLLAGWLLAQEGWTESQVLPLMAASLGHYPPRSVGASGIHLHPSPWSPGSSPTPSIFPPANFFISPSRVTSFPEPIQSVCRSATPNWWSVSCLFVNGGVQDMPCLFSPGVIKKCN